MTRPTEISTYNPHLVPRGDLVASFVARQALLDELVDDLRRGPHQHHLLVGARGSGKTTLLLRLAVAIEDDKKLVRTALPLRFPEEQYNVARPSDLWLNCLDALTDALEARGDHQGKRKLEAAVASITSLPEEERRAQALAELIGWARKARRFLVLLVDNFDLILERLRDAQWALREALSHDNGLVLVGATSRFLEDTISYESPLYDFFRVHELGQVSEQEARAVIAHLAKVRGQPQVQEVLETDPARFKALYLLTGGMPRMLVLLSSVLARDSASVEEDLDRMLDQLTPYYKARFDELPAQSQVVVDAVALHWHPITAAACAEQTRLDVKVVSAQLHRLTQQGLLTKIALPGSAKLGFLLTERFFNVWYLMRSSRRMRQKLAWFVEFLRLWYGEEELARRAQALLDANPGASDPARMLALATAIPDAALRRRLESRAVSMLLDRARTDQIRELLDLDGDDAHLAPVLDRAEMLKHLRSRIGTKPRLAQISEALLESPIFTLSFKIEAVEMLVRSGAKATDLRRLVREFAPLSEQLGTSLIRAISSGEIPSLPEVTTRDDVGMALGLAKDPELAAFFMIVGEETDRRPAADNVFRWVLECGPEYIGSAFRAIAVRLDKGDWPLVQRRVRDLLRQGAPGWGSPEWVSHTLYFLHDCVQAGRALDAASVLAELDLSIRLPPLYEALRAAGASDPDLRHLAPEVRAIATKLLAFLLDRDASLQTGNPPSRKPRSHGAQPQPAAPGGATDARRRRSSRRPGRGASGGSRRARARRR